MQTTSETREGRRVVPLWARIILVGWSILIAVTVPENLRTWGSPGASVLPSSRNMPEWANYVVGALMVATVVILVGAWIVRRGPRSVPSTVRAVVVATAVGQLLWAGVLTASQIRALSPDGSAPASGAGAYLDGLCAVAALATAVALFLDARALASPGNRASSGGD